MKEIRAYAAAAVGKPLEPFAFDPGELGAEEVDIEVSHCGICHSDVSMLDNAWGMATYPFVPGHEVIGRVAAVGSGAKGVEVGQRVGVGWFAFSCQSCFRCLAGEQHLCAEAGGTIVGRFGGFAERVRVQWTWARPLPEGLDPARAGPLLCGGITVFTPFYDYGVKPTARVGVIGIGGLGHLALQFANKWGCEVHAFTTSEAKEAEARKMGAHVVHNTRRPEVWKKVRGCLDLLISTVNVSQDTPELLKALAPKGRLHVVGAVLQPLEVPAFSLISGQKSVSGSPTGSPSAIDAMLAFCARHGIAPVTETLPMSRANEALERLREGEVRYRFVLENDWT